MKVKIFPPGPVARQMMSKDSDLISHSLARQAPLVVESGQGCDIIDVDGNEYLDFSSGMLSCNIGYRHHGIVKAAKDQVESLFHSPYSFFYNNRVIDLAERLSKVIPIIGDTRFFFCCDGDEAIDSSVKLIEWHMRRNSFLAFTGSYHGEGVIGSALSAVSRPRRGSIHAYVRVAHLPAPYCYRCPFSLNSSSCKGACIDYIEEEVLDKVISPEDVAALFFQPIFTEYECIFPPRDYFLRLRKLADKVGFLLVADESRIGLGRLGSWFAVDYWKVKPDVLIAPNNLAEGFPLGVVASNFEIMDWYEGVHTTHLGGNLVACKVAEKGLEVLREERMLENANREGIILIKRLKELQEKFDRIGDIRGRGLFVGVEALSTDLKSPGLEEARRILKYCWRRGLILSISGEATLRLTPPLSISRHQIESAVELLEGAFREILRG